MTDIQTVFVLAGLLAAFAIKRLLLDKYLYKMQVSHSCPVISEDLKTIFLELPVWRKYYSPIWILCSIGVFLGPMIILIMSASMLRGNIEHMFYFLLGIAWLIVPFWLWYRRVKGLRLVELGFSTSPEKHIKQFIS